jgi:hypothetical protein
LSDGEDYYAYYTVYYQSEIINADFEFPTTANNDYYAFFPNGWPELHWKTTAPGTGSNLTKDIEYGYPARNNSDLGVKQAASGSKTAEINAEAFGALYQDVISVPGEEIVWNFSHAPRSASFVTGSISNAMFIVLGPTEAAQMLEAEDLEKLGAQAKSEAGAGNTNFLSGKEPVQVKYEYVKDETKIVATYTVWYHDAGNRNLDYSANNNYGWTKLEGSYETPANQYRTRLFFMSEKDANSRNPNTGNLIDQARGGQYRKYVIEYYSEVLLGDNRLQVTPLKTVEGEALLHSSVKLEDLMSYMKDATHPYYLHKILINGGNYPYNVRFDGDASLYVEKYEDAKGFNRGSFGEGDYDIVMQIYLRDVATTVQSKLVFPAKMTEAQKLSVIEVLKGYQTTVKVVEVLIDENGEEKEGKILDVGVATITKRDPQGNYTAYYYFDKNIFLTKGAKYRIVQNALPEEISNKTGLILDSNNGTQYYTYYYENGAVVDREPDPDPNNANIKLSDARGFAEVVIVNTYVEKTTTIYYKAVGNGKVAFANVENDDDLNFVDTPTEELAFYTDEAIGAKVFAGTGATFVGWFKDEACTDKVTEADGVVDGNSFKPNANIIEADEITFYAKFETGSIVIKRENANPGQSFVYLITSTTPGVSMYVSLQCDENGAGEVAVLEAALGTYTVTEQQDWSWRHEGATQTKSHEGSVKKLTFEFDSEVTKKQWLNGCGKISSNKG